LEAVAGLSQDNNATRVWSRLLDQGAYNPDKPPLVQGVPLQVGVGMKLNRVDIDIHEAKMRVTAFMRMSWLDDRLLYNGSEEITPTWVPMVDFLPSALIDGVEEIVWIPDVQCANCDDQQVDNQGVYIYDQDHAQAQSNQYPFNVYSGRPVKLQAPCLWSMIDFPFDSPSCNLSFWSWMYHGNQLNVTLMTGSDTDGVEWDIQKVGGIGSAEYEFVHARAKHILEQYQMVGKVMPWPKVTYVIEMRRKTETYVVNIIIPLACIVLLGNCVFVLPLREGRAGSGERLGYAITLFLTIVAICLFTSGLRPLLSYSVWLDRYQVRCVVLTMIPVAETVVLFYMTNVTEDAKKYLENQHHDFYQHGDRVRVRNSSFEPWQEGTVHRYPRMSESNSMADRASHDELNMMLLVQADGDEEPKTWNHHELVRRTRASEQQEAAFHIAEADAHRDSNVYDEFLVWHRALQAVDRSMHNFGFNTAFAKQLSWRAVDTVLRHMYPILCYIALHQLYLEIRPEFKTEDHAALQVFGGFSLVHGDMTTRLWNGSAFVLQGLWFLYSSCHLGCWALLNLYETLIMRRSRHKIRKHSAQKEASKVADVLEGDDGVPVELKLPERLTAKPSIAEKPSKSDQQNLPDANGTTPHGPSVPSTFGGMSGRPQTRMTSAQQPDRKAVEISHT